jgi:6-phosphogluconolactonase
VASEREYRLLTKGVEQRRRRFVVASQRILDSHANGCLNTPSQISGPFAGAQIMVAPSGKFLYTSNRGHDSIAIFSIDPSSLKITLIGFQATQGETPRMFNLDPSGKFLHVANQSSSNIVSYRIDATTGMLTATGQYLASGTPACIQFAY